MFLFRVIFMGLFLLFMVNGCTPKIPELDDYQPMILDDNKDNSWAKKTNIDDEDIDISDIDETLTVDETVISENPEDAKIQRVPFPIDEYRKLARRGKGTVKGRILLQDAYEKEILGSGTRLYLNPITSYSKQWYQESYLGGYKMQKADTRLFNYLRFTASNSAGEFAFYGVPNGKYYLIGTVKCAQECGYETQKNIRIATIVKVKGKEIITKDLIRLID